MLSAVASTILVVVIVIAMVGGWRLYKALERFHLDKADMAATIARLDGAIGNARSSLDKMTAAALNPPAAVVAPPVAEPARPKPVGRLAKLMSSLSTKD